MNRLDVLVQEPPEITADFHADPRAWLNEQVLRSKRDGKPGFQWLLAFAEDGVIWGLAGKNGLELADRTAKDDWPALRAQTLLECRLFGGDGELLLWKDGNEWRARLLQENGQAVALDYRSAGDSAVAEYLDEPQVLWGTEIEDGAPQGFTRLIERRQNGLRQVAPVEVSADDLREAKLKLTVRHYVNYDAHSGEARLALSRLAWLGVEDLTKQNPWR